MPNAFQTMRNIMLFGPDYLKRLPTINPLVEPNGVAWMDSFPEYVPQMVKNSGWAISTEAEQFLIDGIRALGMLGADEDPSHAVGYNTLIISICDKVITRDSARAWLGINRQMALEDLAWYAIIHEKGMATLHLDGQDKVIMATELVGLPGEQVSYTINQFENDAHTVIFAFKPNAN